jgi:hypothetical protein
MFMTTTGVGVIGTITGTEVIGDGIAGMAPDGDGVGTTGMVRAGMLVGAGAGIHGTIGTVRVGEATMAIMDTIIGEVITMAEEEVQLTHTATV